MIKFFSFLYKLQKTILGLRKNVLSKLKKINAYICMHLRRYRIMPILSFIFPTLSKLCFSSRHFVLLLLVVLLLLLLLLLLCLVTGHRERTVKSLTRRRHVHNNYKSPLLQWVNAKYSRHQSRTATFTRLPTEDFTLLRILPMYILSHSQQQVKEKHIFIST